MNIEDMLIKLIYQNEFAGGHLIKNENDSLCELEDECCFLEQRSLHTKIPDDAFENIGNNLCRLHLTVLK